MACQLQIKLMGDFRLTRGNQSLGAGLTPRVQTLLAYLALRRGAPQSRARVAYLLWPDSSEKQALTNLRHSLHELHKALPESSGIIIADSRSLCWGNDADVILDIAEFDTAKVAAEEAARRSDNVNERKMLEAAVRLHGGELLPDCTSDWMAPDRERLRQECTGALHRLIRICEDGREYGAALQHATRLQLMEPAHELTYCALMRLHMLSGDRAAALQAYQQGVRALQRELAVGPGRAMRELHDRLLSGEPMAANMKLAAPADGPELPLHGRHEEWLRLREAWTQSTQGRAQLLAIVGEPGIGKSRLAEELCTWLERQGGVAVRTRSYAAEGRLAFAPVAQWLRSPALNRHLVGLDAVWLVEIARILPEFRRSHPQMRDTVSTLESWQRHRFFEALCRGVLLGGKPLLLLLDDLQWTDDETLEWLRFLLRFAPEATLLIVSTVRREGLELDHPVQRLLQEVARDDRLVCVQLRPLAPADAVLVAADVAGRPLSGAEAAWLSRETQGNPLFVVEWARAGLFGHDAGGPAATLVESEGVRLPPKVHAVITARLAQLSPAARELAGVAAVIGRAGTFDEFIAVANQPENAIVPAAEELLERRVLREAGRGAYDFTHDKLRDVAYAQLSAPRKQILHRRTAEVLQTQNASNLEAVWPEVGAHFAAAGRTSDALAAFERAAAGAKRVHANEEAARLYQKALALLAMLPSPERAGRELELNTALGVCLIASHGYPDSAVWGVYERAVELCRQLGRPTAAPILRALAIASLTRGDLVRAEQLGQELLSVHARERDPAVYVEGHYVLGVSYFWLGRFSDSRVHLEEALASYDPGLRNTHIALYAQDPKAVCLSRLAWTLVYLGDHEQALARLDEALALVRDLDHPHTQAYVVYFGALACVDLREEERAAELLRELGALTSKHTLGFWEYRRKIVSSLRQADAVAGTQDHDWEEVLCGLPDQAWGPVNASQFLGLKARAHLHRGCTRAGLASIDAAFALLEGIDERYYVAELHRLRGELLLAQRSDPVEIADCFQRALQLSHDQGARLLELRAATSLARLWRGQRKRRAACDLLENACRSFSAGFAAADLREAQALLDNWKSATGRGPTPARASER